MKTYIYRYFWFVTGVVLNSFGIAFITKASLGTSPISSVPYVLSFKFPLTFGQLSFIMNMLFIMAQFIILRSEFRPVQLLQIGVNIIFSACIDIGMALLSWFTPANTAMKLISLTVGCSILAVGISIEVAPNVLMVPGEGLVSAISTASGWKFGTVKVLFDVSLMASAAAFSFLFFHRLQGLGIGTIIAALIVGRFVNIANKRLPLVPYIRQLT